MPTSDLKKSVKIGSKRYFMNSFHLLKVWCIIIKVATWVSFLFCYYFLLFSSSYNFCHLSCFRRKKTEIKTLWFNMIFNKFLFFNLKFSNMTRPPVFALLYKMCPSFHTVVLVFASYLRLILYTSAFLKQVIFCSIFVTIGDCFWCNYSKRCCKNFIIKE